MPETPPTAGSLADALSRIRFDCDLAEAAAFLASPTSCTPGPGAGARDGKVWVRDEQVDCGPTLLAAARGAAEASSRAHRDGDRYLNLDADPSLWFKVVITGTRRLVAGPSLLWGSPRVWAEDGIRPSQVAAFIHHYRTGALDTPPALIAAGSPFLVDSRGRELVLRTAPTENGAVPEPRSGTLGGQVADHLDCVAVSVAPTGNDCAGPRAGAQVLTVTLRTWLPGTPGARLVRVRVKVHPGGWEFADVEGDVPGADLGVHVTYDPGSLRSRRGETPEMESQWVAGAGRSWVHRRTGVKVTEVR